MRHDYSAKLGAVLIRQLEAEDIELLRKWRNDKETTKFLRDVGYITEEMQRRWYESYLDNEHDLVFAIEETEELGRVVGSLSLYDWDKEKKTCEIGKIQIGDIDAHGKGIGRKTLVMAMKIAFKKLGILKIVASVHPDNIQAYKNDMAIGFRVVGEIPSVAGGNELLLEMTEEDARKTNIYYDEINV